MKNQLLVAVACGALLSGAVYAQEAREKDAVLEEARQHVAKAKVHYDLGEFKEAADEYILVYRLRPIPALLFNVAQAYRQAGLYDKARSFYRSYLREVPDAKNKSTIEQAIREMDEILAKEKRAKDKPPTGVKEPPEASLPMQTAKATPPPVATPPVTTPPAATAPAWGTDKPKPPAVAETPKPGVSPVQPAPKPPTTVAIAPATTPVPAPKPAVSTAPTKPAPTDAVSLRPTSRPSEGGGGIPKAVPWVVAGASVALLGGGGLFYTKASSNDSDLQNSTHTRAQADDLISQSNSNHQMSAILLGAGAAAAAAAVVLFVLTPGDSK